MGVRGNGGICPLSRVAVHSAAAPTEESTSITAEGTKDSASSTVDCCPTLAEAGDARVQICCVRSAAFAAPHHLASYAFGVATSVPLATAATAASSPQLATARGRAVRDPSYVSSSAAGRPDAWRDLCGRQAHSADALHEESGSGPLWLRRGSIGFARLLSCDLTRAAAGGASVHQ